MTRFKRLVLWLITSAIVASLAGFNLRRSQAVEPQATSYQISKSEMKEWKNMMMCIDYGDGLYWKAAQKHAMLKKANWLANRLNLPVERPFLAINSECSWVPPFMCVLMRPAPTWSTWFPDTVLGMHIYDTNIPGQQRIDALKIAMNGILDTPSYEFNFHDGQLMELVRRDISQGEPYGDRFDQRRNEIQSSPAAAEQAYQLATQWLAAADVNLSLLGKSRLPHPVHQGEYQPPGASQAQPVYFVDWGTNYYEGYYIYKTWHTNQWHPAVTVEIGPNKELLELYVRDMTFYRDPPMLINNVWQLTHTPDPSMQQLQNPTLRESLAMTPQYFSFYSNAMCPPLSVLTNGIRWKYEHHLLDERATIQYSNTLNWIRAITNQP